MKFSEPAWPKDLHGMIMTEKDFLLPEVWFRDVAHKADPDEPAKAYAVGFTTSEYAARIQSLPKKEVIKRCVEQLDTVFSLLEPHHLSADAVPPTATTTATTIAAAPTTSTTTTSATTATAATAATTTAITTTATTPADSATTAITNAVAPAMPPRPSNVFLGAMFWDWNPAHHPYIGDGDDDDTLIHPIHPIHPYILISPSTRWWLL